MTSLKLIGIGTSVVAVLPEEILERLNVEERGTLYEIETSGGYLITSREPALAAQLAAGSEFIQDFEETFKVLAR